MVFLCRVYTLKHLFVIPNLFKFLTLFRSQFVILDAPVYHLREMALCLVRHKVSIIYSLIKGIFKVWLILQFQESECILVYLVTRSCCQTYQQRIEVLEYGSILAKYRPVCLIYYNQVEMPHTKLHIILVDVVHHCLVCREYKTCIQVWLIII